MAKNAVLTYTGKLDALKASAEKRYTDRAEIRADAEKKISALTSQLEKDAATADSKAYSDHYIERCMYESRLAQFADPDHNLLTVEQYNEIASSFEAAYRAEQLTRYKELQETINKAVAIMGACTSAYEAAIDFRCALRSTIDAKYSDDVIKAAGYNYQRTTEDTYPTAVRNTLSNNSLFMEQLIETCESYK